ncbi:MAG: HTTM domain-containing protein [Bacteroidetes bacterium]|nr:HTTM domain-containing protein [Bacteroidota bacterium]
MRNSFFFKQIDNSALIVFRMMFGLLLFLEAVGAIFTGWVRLAMIEPTFTFSFIGFEWLQPLPGLGMYFYYLLMGVFGFMVMIGYRYRLSMVMFTLMWTVVYLMQKSFYNNHYYFLILLCGIMIFLPANRAYSLDAKRKPEIRSESMPAWCKWIVVLQVWIVYTFASVAKLYPDWLDGTVAAEFMLRREDYPIIGAWLQQTWVHYVIIYFGILYDLLVVPLLLYKRTRLWAFFLSIFFHIFNSIVFQIGIFPYLSLAFTLFFFEPKTIAGIFLKSKKVYSENIQKIPQHAGIIKFLFISYLCVQLLLPLRHWAIPGDVLWTEEGHRMSWRMMLRTKKGFIKYKVVNKETGEINFINPVDSLTAKQMAALPNKPDFIWQYAQRLKKQYQEKALDVAVYAIGKVSVNNRSFTPLIDPEVDLAAEDWSAWCHHPWILPKPVDKE